MALDSEENLVIKQWYGISVAQPSILQKSDDLNIASVGTRVEAPLTTEIGLVASLLAVDSAGVALIDGEAEQPVAVAIYRESTAVLAKGIFY